MKAIQHTLGPWVRSADGQRIIGADGESVIASVFGAAVEDQDGSANALLISAAPELLAACDVALRHLERHDQTSPSSAFASTTAELRAAIAKARGAA